MRVETGPWLFSRYGARAHQGLSNARARRSLLAVVLDKPPAVQLLWQAISPKYGTLPPPKVFDRSGSFA